MIYLKEVIKIVSIYHPLKEDTINMAMCLFVDEEGREHEQVVEESNLDKFYEDEAMTIPKEIRAKIETIVIGDRIRTIISPSNKT